MNKTIYEGMTNAQVFKEIFGFPPSPNARCVAPKQICENYDTCRGCPFADWWNKEYLPCFELNEKLKED